MPRKPDRKCNLCGEVGWSGTSSLPEGQYRCRGCRRIEPQPFKPDRPGRVPATCAECSAPYMSVRRSDGEMTTCCSKACAQRRRMRLNPPTIPPRPRKPSKARDPYLRRAANAPGPSHHFRKRLLDKWRRQGRTCTYCAGPCEAVDHVVPLKRGGTNYEGNLTPVCNACNASKSAHLLVVWRYRIGGRRGEQVHRDDRFREVRRPASRAA
jgi:hypothetical protein